MSSRRLITLLPWIHVLILIVFSRDIKFDDVRLNTFLHGHIVRTLEIGVPLKCMQYCVLNGACESIIVNKRTGRCNLLDVALTDSKGCGIYTTKEDDWIYYGPRQITVSGSVTMPSCFNPCAMNPCRKNELCDFNGFSHTCACPPNLSGLECLEGEDLVCESHSAMAEIICPNGTIILMQKVQYGVTGPNICSDYIGNCYVNGISKVQSLCNGKLSCSFSARLPFFVNDPCSGKRKYTEMKWLCAEPTVKATLYTEVNENHHFNYYTKQNMSANHSAHGTYYFPSFYLAHNYQLELFVVIMQSIFIAPETGNYIFYIGCDDRCILYIGTNENEETAYEIAYNDYAVGRDVYDQKTTQISSPISLVKDQKYYMEVMYCEKTLYNWVGVAMKAPSFSSRQPLTADHLSLIGL